MVASRKNPTGLSEAERADSSLWKKADLLVPRWLIRGVNERVDCFGAVVCPLSDEEVEDTVKELLKSGVESFAVCLLWSFLNPAHERQAKRVIESVVPASFVTLSSDIAPGLGEYERMATTVINSYLGPGTGTRSGFAGTGGLHQINFPAAAPLGEAVKEKFFRAEKIICGECGSLLEVNIKKA